MFFVQLIMDNSFCIWYGGQVYSVVDKIACSNGDDRGAGVFVGICKYILY